ncbi:hypothetical protein [Spirillospora sp. CA-294931]|uniref:hypothetical protein n=1 Tax=Spirillospora sp. CA-294931 TaxID=3240042 RepID=UPI003D9357FD
MSRVLISRPGPEPEGEPPSQGLRVLFAAAALGCLVALAVAGTRLGAELTRDPTDAERGAARERELSGRYLAWTAGRIFPSGLPYTLDLGSREVAGRVGIDPGTDCERAVDRPLAGTLTIRECRAVLRATYLDQLQGLAITVGVVVFPDAESARSAAEWFPEGRPRPGLRALSFPGSPTARFGDAARQSAAVRHGGPYVVAATVGYADGRPTVREKQRQRILSSLPPRLTASVLARLTAPAPVRCGEPGWSC